MKTIAIDFDACIHKYSKGWSDGTCYDEPVEGAMRAIHNFLRQGYSVFVLSTRKAEDIDHWFINAPMPYGVAFSTMIIPDDAQFWNQQYIVGITNRKLPAHVYIDDRAVVFNGDWEDAQLQVADFKTYQEKEKLG